MAETEVPPPLEERLSDDAAESTSDDDDEDDDEPPSLDQLTSDSAAGEKQTSGALAKAAQRKAHLQQKDQAEVAEVADAEEEGPSLRDLMQQEAEAEARKKKAREEKEKKRMEKSFGKGFKLKGFFNRKSKKKNSSSSSSAPKNPDLPYVKASKDDSDINGLRLPEVQEALKKASTQLEEDKSWVTDDLLQKVKKNETLQKAMNNPRFATLVQAMQTNPAAVAERAKTDPELQEFLKVFTGLMGEHFEKIGAVQKTPEQLAKEAAEKEAAEKAAAEAERQRQAAAAAAADPQVQNVLQNQELRAILMDPNIRNILQECTNPAAVRRYMADPVVGPKLRLMMKHGLLQMQ